MKRPAQTLASQPPALRAAQWLFGKIIAISPILVRRSLSPSAYARFTKFNEARGNASTAIRGTEYYWKSAASGYLLRER